MLAASFNAIAFYLHIAGMFTIFGGFGGILMLMV